MKPYSSLNYLFRKSTVIIVFSSSIIFSFGCVLLFPLPLKSEEIRADVSNIPSQEIRILTLNVWSGLTYKGFFKMGLYPDNLKKRYELLVAEIRKLDPDIIAIQEANPLPHYAKRLAEDLNYRVIYRVALGGIRFGSFGIPTNMREGGAILVKKPWTIVDLDKKRLGGTGIATNWFCFHFGEMTQAFLGRAVIKGKPLYIYAVHLHEGPFIGSALDKALERLALEMAQEKVEEARKSVERDIERRRLEIANLIKSIKETLPTGMPAIILGDFNTTVESGELNPLLIDGKWVDSFRLRNPHDEGLTWDPLNNPNFRERKSTPKPYDVLHVYHDSHSYRIDLILVNSSIPRDHILESRVVFTPVEGLSPSDHYGVITTLKW